jgi:hypothetical protein
MPVEGPSQSQSQSGFSQLTMRQRREIIVGLLYYPALTLQIFLRWKTGFRHLKPGRIIGMTLLMLLVAYVAGHAPATFNPFRSAPAVVAPAASAPPAPPPSTIPDGLDAPLPRNWQRMDAISKYQWVHKHQLTPQQLEQRHAREAAEAARHQVVPSLPVNVSQGGGVSIALVLFALAFLAWGLVQRRLRWWDLCRGVRWHTYSRGVSYLVPLLGRVMKESNIVRFIDPLLCFAAGLFFYPFSHALGGWVMFSSMALYIVEQAVYDRELDWSLTQLDIIMMSDVLGEGVRHFSGRTEAALEAPPPMEDTAGIPTGLAPDIEAQIEARRAQQKARQYTAPSPELLDAMRERQAQQAEAPAPPVMAGDVVADDETVL